MKPLNYLKLICSLALILVVGCSKPEVSDPLASIYQTQWQGILSSGNSETALTIAFQQEDWGGCVYKDLNGADAYFKFDYTRFDKVISITSIHNPIINGQWWIYKLTPSEMILKTDPYLEKISHTLTLNRIY